MHMCILNQSPGSRTLISTPRTTDQERVQEGVHAQSVQHSELSGDVRGAANLFCPAKTLEILLLAARGPCPAVALQALRVLTLPKCPQPDAQVVQDRLRCAAKSTHSVVPLIFNTCVSHIPINLYGARSLLLGNSRTCSRQPKCG